VSDVLTACRVTMICGEQPFHNYSWTGLPIRPRDRTRLSHATTWYRCKHTCDRTRLFHIDTDSKREPR